MLVETSQEESRRHHHGRSAEYKTPIYPDKPWCELRDYKDVSGSTPVLVRRHDGRGGG
jgi:hypothetical protein